MSSWLVEWHGTARHGTAVRFTDRILTDVLQPGGIYHTTYRAEPQTRIHTLSLSLKLVKNLKRARRCRVRRLSLTSWMIDLKKGKYILPHQDNNDINDLLAGLLSPYLEIRSQIFFVGPEVARASYF